MIEMTPTTRRAFLAAASGALAACSRSSRPRLNVWNWSNYVAPDTIPNFEREFGAEVRYVTYESNEEMLAKVISGNSGWDVVFPSNYYIGPMTALNLLAPLRHEWLPNLNHLDTPFAAPSWDAELRYSVPYMWGSTGIVVRKNVDPVPHAWADLWNPSLAGKLTMLDDPSEVLGACLKKLGCSLNSSNAEELRRAQGEALRQKPLVRAYANAEVRDQVISGDVLCAQMWATTAKLAMRDSRDIAFFHPREGYALYADNAAVLRESRRPELAHQFVNYLLRPEVAAAVARTTETATANRDARRLMPAAVSASPVLYPPPDVVGRGEWFASLPVDAQRLRDRLWTEIKAA